MKQVSLFLMALFSFFIAQSQDNCQGYFSYKVGTKLEITTYNKKDKVSNILKYDVIKNTPIASGTEITFHNQTFDDKNKLLLEADFIGKCVNGAYFADVRSMMGSVLPPVQAENMEVSVTGDPIGYPHNLQVGQNLDDATFNFKAGMKGGLNLINMTITYTNRKVVAMETIETPAGKFECAKITYQYTMKGLGSRDMTGVEYVAKNVGVVKSEQYDSKGRKASSTLLTKFEM